MKWTRNGLSSRAHSLCLWGALAVLTVALTGGCASDAERHAFDKWLRVDAELYGGRHAGALHAGNAAIPGVHAPQAGARGPLTEDAQLDDYLRYAALHNPGLEAAFEHWKAALERIPQARTLPDPQFTFAHIVEQIESDREPDGQRYSLAQKFPWFGTLELRADVQTDAARAAQARFEAALLALHFDVKRAYYEYYYLARSIEVVRENRNLLEYLEGVVRTRFQAAAAEHPDVIRAQVELGKLDDQLRALVNLRAPLADRLNAALNRRPGTPIPWPQQIPEATGVLDFDRLDQLMRRNNPQLRELQFQSAGRRSQIALAKQQYYPDFMLGIEYGDDTAARMAAMDGGGADMLAGMISIDLPIWREKYDAAVRESLAEFGAATRVHADRQNTLAADLKTAVYHYEDAVRKINLFRDTLVPKAQQALKATEVSFRAGQSTFIELVDAERVMLEFQLSYERALTDGAIRLAQIEQLVGEPVTPAPRPPDASDRQGDGEGAPGIQENNNEKGDSDAP